MGHCNMKKDLRICAKTGMPLDKPTRHRHMRWYFPAIGLAALAWFLIRVLPKPSRAAYPCQQASAPLAAGFVTWLIGLAAPLTLSRKARTLFDAGRFRSAGFLAARALWAAAALVPMRPAPGPSAF